MDNNEYGKLIESFLPQAFKNIYIIDMMSDIVMEYSYEDSFVCNKTIPFTSFYSELEKNVHPEDIKGYVDSITSTYLQENLNKGIDHLEIEYRKKNNEDGNYITEKLTTKLIEVNQKRLALALVENGCKNKQEINTNQSDTASRKIIFDTISNSLVGLSNVVNINLGSEDLEVRSLANYVNNTVVELTNSFPEISKSLSESMISSTNQGTEKTLLVVDDDSITCKLLTKTFEDTYKIIVANNGQEAIDILEKNNDVSTIKGKDKIVGMFLDLNMPVVDGFGVLDYMNEKNLLAKMPVIIISGDYDQETKDRAYLYKIDDVLEKPFNVQVVKHRIKTFVKLYRSNNSINELVLNQHQGIKNVLRTMTKSYLYDNNEDIKRVSSYVRIIANAMKKELKIDDSRVNKMANAAKYYDIGMYSLPKRMIAKGKFTEDEIKIIKGHPLIGKSIFNSVLYQTNDSIFNHYAKNIIEFHEENYDGTGYPYGYSKDKIPPAAQITAVVVKYNELIKKVSKEEALEEIKKLSGTKFNPQIVDCFVKNFETIKTIN